MKKVERIHLRISPELKAMIQTNADAEHRTLNNYIEWVLINALLKDTNQMNVSEYITDGTPSVHITESKKE